jgi:integrase
LSHVAECLYRLSTTGMYYAVIRHSGKIHRRSLETTDLATAKRKLGDERVKITKVDKRSCKITLTVLCDEYLETLRCAPRTLTEKKYTARRVKDTWPAPEGAAKLIGKIRTADVRKWLAGLKGGPAHHNAHLWFIRSVFEHAVENRLLHENPAAGIKPQKRDRPIRSTPTRDQFRAIVDSIRSEKRNAKRKDGADLIEFMGLAGVGNAEVGNLTWGDIDFAGGKITLFRQKTRRGFQVPLYPQLRALLERRKGEEDRKPKEPVFPFKTARGALKTACERLSYPQFDHRAFRRMFITNALEKGIDVKVVAEWQGHIDGGKLILDTYNRMDSAFTYPLREILEGEATDGFPLVVPNPMTSREGVTQKGDLYPRSLDNTGHRKFVVTEFDQKELTKEMQGSIVQHLAEDKAPLVMVVDSGGKSLHAWFACRGALAARKVAGDRDRRPGRGLSRFVEREQSPRLVSRVRDDPTTPG